MGQIDNLYQPPHAHTSAPPFKLAGANITTWFYGASGVAWLIAESLGASEAALGFLLLAGVLGLSWLYQAWSDVPHEDRALTALGDISPGGAVGRLFIPVYGFFWGFAVHAHLTLAIRASLQKRGVEVRAEPGLAYGAMAMTTGGRILSAAQVSGAAMMAMGLSTGLWFAYMIRCDAVRRAMVHAWRTEQEGAPR
jgi:hypothetical protein